jgi:DNA-directed RNA polymerase II subunit RPB2
MSEYSDDLLLDFAHKLFEKEGISHIHKRSFERCISTLLPNLTNDFRITTEKTFGYTSGGVTENMLKKTTKIYLKNSIISRPQHTETDGSITYLSPFQAKTRGLTYGSPWYVDVVKQTIREDLTTNETNEKNEVKRICLGVIPICVGSSYCITYNKSEKDLYRLKECPLDMGGYYIVNGSVKIAVLPEIPNINTYKILYNKKILETEIRSQENFKFKKCKIVYNGEYIYYTNKNLKKKVPIFIVFKALGYNKNNDIRNLIFGNNEIEEDLLEIVEKLEEDAHFCENVKEAQTFIGSLNIYENKNNDIEKSQLGLSILQNSFDHISNDFKPIYFGIVLRKMLEVITNRREPDDRDHQASKRYLSDGEIIASVLKTSLTKLQDEISKRILEEDKNGEKEFNLDTLFYPITKPLIFTMATGNYKNFGGNQTGVFQLLNGLSYMALVSQCRRLISTINKGGNSIKPRLIHHSQYGRICCVETPEGSSAGITKHLATLARITIDLDDTPIIEFVKQLKCENGNYPIFVNGKLIKMVNDLSFPKNKLHKYKLENNFPLNEISIYINDGELHVLTDGGRIIRPLIKVKDGKLSLTVEQIKKVINKEISPIEFTENGIIEYLDVNEEMNALVATKFNQIHDCYDYNYCEIHPSLIMGLSASKNPFPEFNPILRDLYFSNMGKQSKGICRLNFEDNIETLSHILMYPQKAIVNNKNANLSHDDILCSTTNAVVAIIAYGYNQEDSMVLSQTAIDLGFGRSFYMTTYQDTETKSNTNLETFGKGNKKYNSKTDETGLTPPGTKVSEDDEIISKVSSSMDAKYSSTCMKYASSGVIHKVMITEGKDGQKLVKTVVRTTRIPELGDKFASRHSQKGTMGISLSREDLPWTMSGITPDIIINPHAIPSRMTFGHMMEKLLGKAIASGSEICSKLDGTPFKDYKNVFLKDVPNLSVAVGDCLKACGFAPSGVEMLYSGLTGEPIGLAYIGIIAYQSLKHMVADKAHARQRGPKVMLTRQPMEGRSRKGGIRFGEMERDTAIAVGSSEVLDERLRKVSDNFETQVCVDCGIIGTIRKLNGTHICSKCDKNNITTHYLPYATKLLYQELNAMNINVKMNFTEKF